MDDIEPTDCSKCEQDGYQCNDCFISEEYGKAFHKEENYVYKYKIFHFNKDKYIHLIISASLAIVDALVILFSFGRISSDFQLIYLFKWSINYNKKKNE